MMVSMASDVLLWRFGLRMLMQAKPPAQPISARHEKVLVAKGISFALAKVAVTFFTWV